MQRVPRLTSEVVKFVADDQWHIGAGFGVGVGNGVGDGIGVTGPLGVDADVLGHGPGSQLGNPAGARLSRPGAALVVEPLDPLEAAELAVTTGLLTEDVVEAETDALLLTGVVGRGHGTEPQF